MAITQNHNSPQVLSAEIIDHTRTALAGIYAAAHQADFIIAHFMASPLVQAAIERRRASAAARGSRAASSSAPPVPGPGARALGLLSLPAESWHAALASLDRRQQKATLKCAAAAANACARTAPERAHLLADFVLRAVQRDRLPPQALLLRRQLAGHALLARARALITLGAYTGALPVIAEAHAAFPRTEASKRYRIHAQLLRAQVLAATGDAAEALETLTVSARLAIEHIDPRALVDALASIAVILCAHGAYGLARPALALAAYVARQPGNEPSLTALQAGLAECAFLGYASAPSPPLSA
jgi:tetratricopeptide (TPR) repeat protein